MFHSLELKKRVDQSSHVSEMFSIVGLMQDNKTLVTKEGSLLQVLSLEGIDYTGMDHAHRIAIWKNRLTFIQQISTDITISVHYHREKSELVQPIWELDNKYAQEIINKRNKSVKMSYVTKVYLVISLPKKGLMTKGIASHEYKEETAVRETRREFLTENVNKISSVLKDFNPISLEYNEEDNKLYKFWQYLINGREKGVTPKDFDNLHSSLPNSKISFTDNKNKTWLKSLEHDLKTEVKNPDFIDRVVGKVSSKLSSFSKPYIMFDDDRFASPLFIKDFPTELREGCLDDLLSVDHPFNIVQHIRRLEDEKVSTELLFRMRLLQGVSAFNRKMLDEIEHILSQLANDDIQGVFEHSYQVLVFGDTPEEVDEGIAKITSYLAKQSINVTRETTNTETAFWSNFPDYEFSYSKPRIKKITNFALNNFCNFGTKSQGYNKCSFGDEPVAYFNTSENNSYGFIFHANPKEYVNGHTLVVGSPGKGKSVLKSMLMANLLKFNGSRTKDPLKMMVFDNLKGLQVPIKALGGQYIDFAEGDVNLAPMQLDDTVSNRRFLRQWLGQLINAKTDDDYDVIQNIIRTNYEDVTEKEYRSIWQCRGQLNEDYYRKFKPWLPSRQDFNENEGRDTAHLFNGLEDPFSFDNRIIGFNMTQVFNSKELINPVTSYIFHAWKEYIENNTLPNVVIIDEAVNFLRDENFYQFIDLGLREFRKKDGIMMFSIQELSSMYSIKNVSEFLGYIETFVLFPNVNASEQDYVGAGEGSHRGIGLTREEFRWIKSGGSGRPYEFMVK